MRNSCCNHHRTRSAANPVLHNYPLVEVVNEHADFLPMMKLFPFTKLRRFSCAHFLSNIGSPSTIIMSLR